MIKDSDLGNKLKLWGAEYVYWPCRLGRLSSEETGGHSRQSSSMNWPLGLQRVEDDSENVRDNTHGHSH